MENIYNYNGLPFWSEREIRHRNWISSSFYEEIKSVLLNLNSAWKFFQIEAPILTPVDLINPNYTPNDVWMQERIGSAPQTVLRPETTPGSYAFAENLLRMQYKLPLVVWQIGKSFRRENDQVLKNCRFKEFYQQEFQCLYTSDSKCDYQKEMMEPIRKTIESIIVMPTRIVESDRLPSYSKQTLDIEVDNGDKWMEVCSVSTRTDFKQKANFITNQTSIKKDVLVLELALGLDRCVYNYEQRRNRG